MPPAYPYHDQMGRYPGFEVQPRGYGFQAAGINLQQTSHGAQLSNVNPDPSASMYPGTSASVSNTQPNLPTGQEFPAYSQQATYYEFVPGCERVLYPSRNGGQL